MRTISPDDSWLTAFCNFDVTETGHQTVGFLTVHHHMRTVFSGNRRFVTLDFDVSGEKTDLGSHWEVSGSISFNSSEMSVLEGFCNSDDSLVGRD